MIEYQHPRYWIQYDRNSILLELVEARASVLALTQMPSQRSWAERLQAIQLKREVAGTSRIEGADFTERELDEVMKESPEELLTRSQRQAAAAVNTYRWISGLPDDQPIDTKLICEIHQRLVVGADDDHCAPGKLRVRGENVNFGSPRHRGAEGGDECVKVFNEMVNAFQREFQAHDPLVQALALHYHFAAMHPFLDGNGRTARAIEALLLQRVGLKDTLFIAMSNYYYEEKNNYLAKLAEVRAHDHDLTPFLKFGLKGITLQCRRLIQEIRTNVQKALFRNVMYDLFKRLKTPRKRVMAERHIEVLKVLLEFDTLSLTDLIAKTRPFYHNLQNKDKAIIRDLVYLLNLKAIIISKNDKENFISIRLEWPTEITETEFFIRVKKMPKAKSHNFLS